MKRILSCLLAGVMACVLAVACFACNAEKPGNNKTEYFNEYNMYLVYAASENITPLDYKTWLATVKGEKGDKGEDGKSAYQIWLDNGNTGSHADFLEWLKGEQGAPGKDGQNGVDGKDGANGKDGINGVDGKDGVNGKDGADGKSAYQVWLDNGNTGSESDFLEWLRASGVKGKSAYETFKEYYPDYKGTEQEWISAVASGDKCALFGHSFDDGVVTKEPTKGEDGVKTYTCKICNFTKTEVIPKIEVAEAEIYEVDGKKYVNYGSYPQTHVSDAALIEELNKLTETNEKGYYTYNGKEYAKIAAKPYQSGSYNDKYGNTVYYTYSDGARLYNNKTEWFMVEPIKWRVLEENEGSVKVVSTMILDRSRYYVNTYYRNIDGVDIAPNNYKYSTLREFLNNGFYNAAFTTAQQNTILLTEVDNSASSTGNSSNQYACENTQDKVFALSYSEAFNNSSYFANNAERQLKVTDYAKATGAWFGTGDYENVGWWWLRSPYNDDGNYAYGVDGHGNRNRNRVYDTSLGVVPALQISLG